MANHSLSCHCFELVRRVPLWSRPRLRRSSSSSTPVTEEWCVRGTAIYKDLRRVFTKTLLGAHPLSCSTQSLDLVLCLIRNSAATGWWCRARLTLATAKAYIVRACCRNRNHKPLLQNKIQQEKEASPQTSPDPLSLRQVHAGHGPQGQEGVLCCTYGSRYYYAVLIRTPTARGVHNVLTATDSTTQYLFRPLEYVGFMSGYLV